jgi:hypothetical protein
MRSCVFVKKNPERKKSVFAQKSQIYLYTSKENITFAGVLTEKGINLINYK